MGGVPFYLTWFFLQIRSNAGKKDYLVDRFKKMPFEKAAIEVQMINKLYDLNLIGKTEKVHDLVLDSNKTTIAPGVTIETAGEERHLYFPPMFTATPKGTYFIRESIITATAGFLKTAVVALLGAIAALLIHG